MNTRRELLIAGGAWLCVLAAPPATFAQQKAKVWRIGFLGQASATGGFERRVEEFRKGLRDLGYVEGKNILIEYRWAEGNYERLPQLASELVRLKVDLIVTHGGAGSRAAIAATTSIPIVIAASGDLVALGLVTNLARPGGNVTGSTGVNPETAAKRLEFLKDAFPSTRQVAFLLNPENPAGIGPTLRAVEATARALKLELHQLAVRRPADIDSAYAAMTKRRIDAVLVGDDAVLTVNAEAIANVAAKMRLPSIGLIEFAEAGGLMAYAADRRELFRRAATFVDKIFKGAKPGDLPFEQATKFEFVVNRKTAKALGIEMSQSVLFRADRVIE